MYQPFAALLEEEAERALAKKGAADANVSEKDLPSLAAALDRCEKRVTTHPTL